jgi:hypothetical protein
MLDFLKTGDVKTMPGAESAEQGTKLGPLRAVHGLVPVVRTGVLASRDE